MVAQELRSRARRYGYTGKTVEQMLADLHVDGSTDTMLALVREYERAAASVRDKNNANG